MKSTTSQAKIEANRRNAQRSTGPRTSTGKAASSRNAVRTGLTTLTLTVMPGECQQDLDELSHSIRNEWNPQGDHENFLVDQMISARWRLERLARYEEEAMNKAIDGPAGFITNEGVRRFEAKSAHRRVLDAIDQPNSIFDKLERYTRAAERAYSKAVKELKQHRANQAKTVKQNEATAKRNQAMEKPKPNKAKEAEDWLRASLDEIEKRDHWSLEDDPTYAPRPNEPNFTPLDLDSTRS